MLSPGDGWLVFCAGASRSILDLLDEAQAGGSPVEIEIKPNPDIPDRRPLASIIGEVEAFFLSAGLATDVQLLPDNSAKMTFTQRKVSALH
jgi:hypothetical protein